MHGKIAALHHKRYLEQGITIYIISTEKLELQVTEKDLIKSKMSKPAYRFLCLLKCSKDHDTVDR